MKVATIDKTNICSVTQRVILFHAMITTSIGNTYVELVRDGAQTVVQAYCHGFGVLITAHLRSFASRCWRHGLLKLYKNDRTFVRKTIFWVLTLRLDL